MMYIHKYPRTPHIEGSGIQKGDEDLTVRPLSVLMGKRLVIEEKMDGANSAVSFSPEGRLLLQSRGHFLLGGPREAQFHLFKSWAHTYTSSLWEALGERYVMYGEWLYAKHTIFYTDLPHYFLEFDLYDTVTGDFLSTERRREMLQKLSCVVPVKVLYEGQVRNQQQLVDLIGRSYFISDDHLVRLRELCEERHVNAEMGLKETDASALMEGLYIKVEEDGVVKERYKYVRSQFLQTVLDTGSHWLDRPLLPNRLKEGTVLF